MTVPDCRTLAIEAENRTLAIEAEGTGSAITIIAGSGGGSPMGFALLYLYSGVDAVTVSGTPLERTLVIEAEDRTMTIEACTDGG